MPSLRPRLVVAAIAAAVSVLGLAAIGAEPAAGRATTDRVSAARVSAARATPYADWPTYHGNIGRTGRSATMPPAVGAPRISRQLRLDGAVYASPIVMSGRTVVATENNTVYYFGPKMTLGWKRHLGTPSPASERPCGNIDPLGITGTPVYSAKYDTIYVAAELSRPVRHVLYALDRKTGRIKWQHSLDFGGVDAVAMQQRGALTIAGGRVLVPFGGLAGDCAFYKGRVVGYDRTGRGRPSIYTVPTLREGGIWTPPGPTVDAFGHAYVAVGNGAAVPGSKYDYTDSVLRLATGSLDLQQYFSPWTWADDNASDLDLGSTGPTLIAGHWVLAVGKSGTGYVLDRAHLGGIGGALARASICGGAYGGTAVYGHDVYVPCNDGLRKVTVDNRPSIHVRWKSKVTITGSPVLGGGRVWSLDPFSGILYSLSGATGRVISATNVGGTSRFATPSIYGRRMVVPTMSGITVLSTS